MPENRAEHVRWCKERAFQILDSGDHAGAVASMISDMSKNEDTKRVMDPMFAMIGMMEAQRGPEAARRWIDGFFE